MAQNILWHTEQKKLSEIIPSKFNPRKLTDKQYQDLKKSLKKFDLAEIPVINKDGTLLAGHQRVKILLELYGQDHTIDVRIPNKKLAIQECKEYNIRSNKNTGEWDFDMLADMFEIDELKEWGFEDWELRFDEEEEKDGIIEDNYEEKDEIKTDIKYGDLFKIGKHKLLCGDSRKKEDVIKLMDDIKPILMITDPPYGVNYSPEWREGCDLSIGKRSKGKVENDDIIDWTESYKLFEGYIVYVWHAGKYTDIVKKNLEDCDFEIISQIIWAKQHFVLSRGDYHWQHEPCWYAVKKGNNHNWQGARDQSTLWDIKNNNSFGNSSKEETFGHGTQKPIECMARPILNNTKKNDIIYDPFLGSGTTMVAAQQLDRICYGIEIDPKYCQVIINRMEKVYNIKSLKIN